MSQSPAASRSESLFPRTRQRIERELNSLSERALADIGLYRSDINEFAYAASVSPASEPLLQAVLADIRQLLRVRKASGFTARAAE
jgi:hypothetical protein